MFLLSAVIGAFIVGVMNNGMSIMGIGIDWQQVISGAVPMLAVFLDVYYKNKRWARRSEAQGSRSEESIPTD